MDGGGTFSPPTATAAGRFCWGTSAEKPKLRRGHETRDEGDWGGVGWGKRARERRAAAPGRGEAVGLMGRPAARVAEDPPDEELPAGGEGDAVGVAGADALDAARGGGEGDALRHVLRPLSLALHLGQDAAAGLAPQRAFVVDAPAAEEGRGGGALRIEARISGVARNRIGVLGAEGGKDIQDLKTPPSSVMQRECIPPQATWRTRRPPDIISRAGCSASVMSSPRPS